MLLKKNNINFLLTLVSNFKNINKRDLVNWKFRFKSNTVFEENRTFLAKNSFKLWIKTSTRVLTKSLGNFNFKTLFKHFNTFNNLVFCFYLYNFKVIYLTNKALRFESASLNSLSGVSKSYLSQQYLGGIRNYKYHAVWLFRILKKIEKPSLVIVSDDLLAKSAFSLPRKSFSVQFGEFLRLNSRKFHLTLPIRSNHAGSNFIILNHVFKLFQISNNFKTLSIVKLYFNYKLLLKTL